MFNASIIDVSLCGNPFFVDDYIREIDKGTSNDDDDDDGGDDDDDDYDEES